MDEWTNLASLDIKFLLPAVSFLTPIHWKGYANYFWAEGDYDATTDIKEEPSPSAQKSKEANEYSWKRAREAFIAALTSKPEEERNRLFARTFRSVGQVVHLLQDMAVPAHVRNDMKGHLYYQKYLNYKFRDDGFFAWIGNNFEAHVAVAGSSYIKSGSENPSFNNLRNYWDEGVYEMSRNIDNIGVGLSEYTSANFLSANRMLNSYPHPSENDGSVVLCEVPTEDGKTDNAYYFKMERGGAKVNHLSHSTILGKYGVHFFDNLDDVCHADYAAKLVPKAVDYSTGLINYFFRGTLEICEPDRFVYSIADGSLDPQQFTYIKAKVRNSTDYNGGPDAPMGPGSLWAVAKYKAGQDKYLYSVSEAIADKTLATDFQEFNFNFSGDPIPVGITDLYLQVVYQGTLGNEIDTAVAVGMKDLNEPAHFVVYNATDYVFFLNNGYNTENYIVIDQNLFNTAADMESGGPRPEGCYRNEVTNIIECPQGICDSETYRPQCVYPYDSTVEIEFSPDVKEVENPQVTYYPLPPGRHGRMILLCDPATRLKANISISAQDAFPYQNNYPCLYCGIKVAATVDSIVAQGLELAPQNASFREISMHNGIEWDHFFWINMPEDLDRPENYNERLWYMYTRVYPYWPVMTNPNPAAFDINAFNP